MRENILLASLISVWLCSLVWIFGHMQLDRYATTAGSVKENVIIIVGIPSSLFQSHISGYFQIASLYFVLLMNNLLTC